MDSQFPIDSVHHEEVIATDPVDALSIYIESHINIFTNVLRTQNEHFTPAQRSQLIQRVESIVNDFNFGANTAVMSGISPKVGGSTSTCRFDRNAEKLLSCAAEHKNRATIEYVERQLLERTRICNQRLIYLADKYGMELLLQKTIQELDVMEKVKRVKMSPMWNEFKENTKKMIFDRCVELN